LKASKCFTIHQHSGVEVFFPKMSWSLGA